MRHPLATLTLALVVGPLAARAGSFVPEPARGGRNVGLVRRDGPGVPGIERLLLAPVSGGRGGGSSLRLAEGWAWNAGPIPFARFRRSDADAGRLAPEAWSGARTADGGSGGFGREGGLAEVLRSGALVCPIDARTSLFLRATREALDGDAFGEAWPDEVWCAEDPEDSGLCFALGIAFGL